MLKMTYNEYIRKLASYDYIIETTKNYKTKRDYIKARNDLIKQWRTQHNVNTNS